MRIKVRELIFDSEKEMISIALFVNERRELLDMIAKGHDIYTIGPAGSSEKGLQEFAMPLRVTVNPPLGEKPVPEVLTPVLEVVPPISKTAEIQATRDKLRRLLDEQGDGG